MQNTFPNRRAPQPTPLGASPKRGRVLFRLFLLLALLLAAAAFGAGMRHWFAPPAPLPPATVLTNTPAPPADSATPEPKDLKPEPIHPLVARNIARRLPARHLTRLPFGDEIAARALSLFLDRLDYDRSVFLASDIEEFRGDADKLDDLLKKGDLDFAFRVFALFKTRLRDRTSFAEALLAKEMDLSVAESFSWKRKDAAWPATIEEWNDLWRRKIKNETLARSVSRSLQEEESAARTNVPPAAVATNENAAFKAWENLSPTEFVRKRYQQQLLIVEDHDAEWVVQNYFSAFCQAYDPHTDYLSPAAAEDFDIDMKLSLSGIGAVLAPEDGVPKIIRIIPGGPAERDGRLQPGDKIVAVAQENGEPVDVLHWPLPRAVRLIRGPRGTKVTLSVSPVSDVSGRTVKIELTRDEVKLEEEAAKAEVREAPGAGGRVWRLGILRLPAFYADMRRKNGTEELRSCAQDARRILNDFATNGVSGLLLDLRDNGGGALGDAVELTGLFLKGMRQPVVQVKESWRVNVLTDPDPAIVFTGRVAVLINRQSASASEILAAALQDYGRAILIGDTKTHGKGTVQSLAPVSDFDNAQGTLKVTDHSFHRIGGGSTQLKGVKADIVLPSALDTLEIGEEFLPYPLPWSVIQAVPFTPVADLAPQIEWLQSRSAARLAASPRFTARIEQIRRLDAMQKSAVISLRLADRLDLARAERALLELQETDEAGGLKKEGASLIEEESLRILVDMLEYEPNPE